MSGEVREQTDLATWLLAQVAEDERRAKAAQATTAHRDEPGGYATWRVSEGGEGIYGEHVRLMSGAFDYLDDELGEHVVAWAPGRVLAECDTKRRILAMFPTSAPKTDGEGNFEGFQSRDCGEHRTVGGRAWCHDCGEWCYPDAPCVRCHGVSDVLRLLALPYRDRPGYVESWSPDGR